MNRTVTNEVRKMNLTMQSGDRNRQGMLDQIEKGGGTVTKQLMSKKGHSAVRDQMNTIGAGLGKKTNHYSKTSDPSNAMATLADLTPLEKPTRSKNILNTMKRP